MTDNTNPREGLLAIGTMLANGKYRIEKYLASGGFGNTYMATDTAFDEKVAIKELFIKGVCGRMHNATDVSISLTENQRTFNAQREKFRKEARRLRKLDHKHIVRVYDLFDENGTTYYVMNFIEGESLSNRLKRTHQPMTEAEIMPILSQTLDALETVHNEGIWHLDLKPANIMVDDKDNVQLIDFGASKQLRNAEGNSLSTSSALACTPGYAPSEQMEQNIEKFGPWTDLYSLGATLYHLLTLQQPPSPSDIDEDAAEALKLPTTVSKKTAELIMWLMKPNRKMRPQCVADVKQFLAETPTKPQTKAPFQKSKQSATNTTTDEGDGDTILKGDKNFKATTQDPTNHTREPSPNKNGKSNKVPVIGGVLAIVIIAAFGYGMWHNQTEANDVSMAAVDSDSVAAEVPEKSVTNLMVSVKSGPKNMRNYAFTGSIADTIGALPQGQGTAKFEKYGSIPAATYTGYFTDGLCDDQTGNATLKFDNGDVYKGTFIKGYYDQGIYTLKDGSCFKGTFKEGSPYKGKWYNPDGSFSEEI